MKKRKSTKGILLDYYLLKKIISIVALTFITMIFFKMFFIPLASSLFSLLVSLMRQYTLLEGHWMFFGTALIVYIYWVIFKSLVLCWVKIIKPFMKYWKQENVK
jgi:hypothetical protein